MALTGNALIAHDNMVSVANNLAELQTAIANAIPALTSASATDSLAKVQALANALAPVAEAVLDASETYTECSNIES